MIAFIEEHQGEFGVEPIRRVLPITPSSCYRHAALARDPDLASDRARQNATDLKEIERVHDESKSRYGARKVWHRLRREGKDIARCTVEQLMREHGLNGVTRGQNRATIPDPAPDPAQACPDDPG